MEGFTMSFKNGHAKINPETLDWQPSNDIMPAIPAPEGEYGSWVKVLKRPTDGGDCWAYLSKTVPPPGKAYRIVARAESYEEVYFLGGGFTDRSGQLKQHPPMYVCNPPGLIHGGIVQEETVQFIHFHGDLDTIMEFEVLDATAVGAGAERD
jgi:hypothetical protein